MYDDDILAPLWDGISFFVAQLTEPPSSASLPFRDLPVLGLQTWRTSHGFHSRNVGTLRIAKWKAHGFSILKFYVWKPIFRHMKMSIYCVWPSSNSVPPKKQTRERQWETAEGPQHVVIIFQTQENLLRWLSFERVVVRVRVVSDDVEDVDLHEAKPTRSSSSRFSCR